MRNMLGINSERTAITGKYAEEVRKQLKYNDMGKYYVNRPAFSRDDVLSEARLYERHYLPQKIHTAILEDFAEAYEVKSHLPSIIDTLKNYFKEPIVDKWIEGVNEHDPGHRGYEHPEPMPEEHRVIAEKYMDMANDFFNWNRDLNCLYFNVCNVSPCSNRKTVEKWYHENGQPDFKIPEDDYWVDSWDDEEESDEEV